MESFRSGITGSALELNFKGENLKLFALRITNFKAPLQKRIFLKGEPIRTHP
jgi:hypothetical protein